MQIRSYSTQDEWSITEVCKGQPLLVSLFEIPNNNLQRFLHPHEYCNSPWIEERIPHEALKRNAISNLSISQAPTITRAIAS